jgi:nicotinate-nucleotide pyrophosphorylase (carboxylating)
MLTPEETANAQRLLEWGLKEDLDDVGDLTSQATIPAELQGQAVFVARATGILAGQPVAQMVFTALDKSVRFEPLLDDGAELHPRLPIARVSGPMRSILSGERLALNFMQRLSGVASQTRHYVDLIRDLPCKLLDTRKTTPGWRLLEKYAVRQGGGHNHRVGLYDGVLIKDNHLAALGTGTDAVTRAVETARQRYGTSVPIEVEVDNLDQLNVALRCAPDIVLLDNMGIDLLREAVRRRNASAPKVLLEASGGVTLTTLRSIAETGVDRISCGALTHSAAALDIALDYSR